ncbi:acyl-CoA dehydrogenase family protein [Burkholderia multivorans]|uniref:Acyl-CoA dehydrogenase family protein n=3 Tax=Burkholderia multivorans TaxID=87883 RepID=A0AAP2MSE5_9BURK|nr:acyl-CoA dehydrogenase family protein [Burkholderia multivorans]MBU9360749.1 acyl-CoA dehydrogenase family protein [Burkholderia multivorans]MBU9366709.1 acyl-CoA dehydrogenase family protein [Burkholderia multivorans]MBU9598422.1 acyl-CoA dehydrogenase family protein [Burkholderia multivorans]MCA8485870.1 acyl-CoA dehydrogenase family protein [Burkholderia multivorans]
MTAVQSQLAPANFLDAHRELVSKATALRASLRSSAREVDAAGKLPDSVVKQLDDAGLFQLMTPSQYGGHQTTLRTYMEAVSEIGRGDPSAAWAATLINICSWLMASLYPKNVQEEVFGSNNKVRAAGVISPRKAKTRRVEGGIVVEEGFWGFNSGVYHADYDLLGIPVVDEAGNEIDQGLCIIPTSQITILNDWNTIALRGSGSSSVTVKDVFVPDERIASLSKAIENNYRDRNEGIYTAAFIPMLAIILVFPALGIAKAAMDVFLEKLPNRGIQYTWYKKQDEAAVTHLQVGEASAKLDAARTIIERAVDEIDANAIAGGAAMPTEQRARIRRDVGYASQLIWEGVDLLATASGGSLAAESNFFNRIWRDARVANLHGVVCTTTNLELYGRIACGKEANTPLV